MQVEARSYFPEYQEGIGTVSIDNVEDFGAFPEVDIDEKVLISIWESNCSPKKCFYSGSLVDTVVLKRMQEVGRKNSKKLPVSFNFNSDCFLSVSDSNSTGPVDFLRGGSDAYGNMNPNIPFAISQESDDFISKSGLSESKDACLNLLLKAFNNSSINVELVIDPDDENPSAYLELTVLTDLERREFRKRNLKVFRDLREQGYRSFCEKIVIRKG